MSRVFLVLLVIAGLSAGVLWTVASSSEARGKPPARVETTEQEPASVATLAPPAETQETREEAPETSAPAPSPASPTRVAVAAPREEELARAQWVSGRVILPEGTPLDEEAWVVAVGRGFADGSDHRARVEPDGSFRAAFSEKTRTGRFKLEARYLRMTGIVRWKKDADEPVVLEPVLGGRIEGRLVPPAGESVEGSVGLTVTRHEGSASYLEEAGEKPVTDDLSVAFDALAVEASYEIAFDGPRWVGNSPALTLEPGKTRRIELELRPGVVLSGIVRDESGAVLSGVGISAQVDGQDFRSSTFRAAESGPDGRFELEALSPGRIRIDAALDGLQPLELSLGKMDEGETRTDLELVLARGNSIAGSVRWPDGTPAKAKVELTPTRGRFGGFGGWEESVTVDCRDDGRFEATGLREGPYRVQARASKEEETVVKSDLTGRDRKKTVRTPFSAERAEVAVGTRELDLTLSTGLALTGSVVDDRGLAVADFRIVAERVLEDDPWGLDDDTLSRSFRDTDGTFRLEGFVPGEWEIVGSGGEHAASRTVRVTLPCAEPVRLVVPREACVTGVVLDPSGAPAEGVRVLAVPSEDAPHFMSMTSSDRSDRTDADGHFRVTGLPPGTVVVMAESERSAPSQPRELDLLAGQEASGLCLQLERGASIVGQVIGADGRPEHGARVSLSHGADTVTDEEGRFEAGALPEVELHVSVSTTSGVQLSRQVSVTAGETTRVVLQVPAGGLVRVHGRVRAGGMEREHGSVYAMRRQDDEEHAQTSAHSEIGSDGYEISLPAGPYWLMVSLESGIGGWCSYREALDVPDVEEYAFDVSIALGRISGRVTGADGRPLPGVWVRSEPERHEEDSHGSMQALTDADGRYELSVPPGLHTVVAGGDQGWRRRETESYGEARATGLVVEENGHVRSVDLVLHEGGTLEGTVRRADGAPVEDASVWSEAPSGMRHIGWCENGSFRIQGLEPGTHRIGASQEGRATRETVRVEIEPGKSAEVELVLVPATEVHVTARDASGTRVGCEIEVVAEDRHPVFLERGETGEAWAGPLVEGRYTVRATRDGKRCERALELTGTEGELEVELVFE